MGQEAAHAQPVVDGDQDDPFLRISVSAELYFMAIASHIGSAMNPKDNRQLGLGLSCGGCPNVQVQAVFAAFRVSILVELFPVETARCVVALQGGCAECIALAYALPWFYGLRLFPAQITYGRCGVRYSFVYTNIGSFRGDA